MRGRTVAQAVVVLASIAGISAGAATGLVKTGVVALSRTPEAADALPAASVLKAGESRRVADFESPTNTLRAVFVARDNDDKLCLWDTNLVSGQQGGGCNFASDPFAGGSMMTSVSLDGGPGLGTVSEVRVIGVVDPSVATVEMRDSKGRTRPVHLTKDQAFALAFHAGAIRSGGLPTVLLARDTTGAVIDEEPVTLGIEVMNS